MIKMKFKKISMVCALAVLPTVTVNSVQAPGNSVQDVIDGTYVQPGYALRYSLSDDQRTQTLVLLGYDSSTDISARTITISAYASIIDVADDSSLQLYSSAKVQKLGLSEASIVNTVTPKSIIEVTEDMYRNAAVTLGVEHAAITVVSPIAIIGESILAGIYYSLEENGADVSGENKELAQGELEALSTINSENQGTDGYDADKLSVALADIESVAADAGDGVSKEDVHEVVEEALDDYELRDVSSSDQTTLIVNFVFNLSKPNIIDSNNFRPTLASLKDSIVSNAGLAFKGINFNFDTTDALESSKGSLANI